MDTPSESGDVGSFSSALVSFWEDKLESLGGNSSEDYRIGEAFVKIMSEVDSSRLGKSANFLTNLSKEVRKSNIIRSAAWLVVLRDYVLSLPTGIRLCNELIADGTGIAPQKKRSDGKFDFIMLHRLS
jgi:hypothetical protein